MKVQEIHLRGCIGNRSILGVLFFCSLIVNCATSQQTLIKEQIPWLERSFPPPADKFTFAILGDGTGANEGGWPIFDRAIIEINRLRPDFVIMPGDVIEGYTSDPAAIDAQWREFWKHASQLQMPLFLLPGNHDIFDRFSYNYWRQNCGSTYYSFDYKGCHFIFLNTEEYHSGVEYPLGKAQLEWFKKDLAGLKNPRHVFVFLHRPFWFYGGTELEGLLRLERYLKHFPYTVLGAHLHNLTFEERNGHPYYIVSSSGASLDPKKTKAFGAFHHFTLVTVEGTTNYVAIVEPGGIHPHNIAPGEFKENLRALAQVEADLTPLFLNAERKDFPLPVRFDNRFEQEATVAIDWNIPPDAAWNIEPPRLERKLAPKTQEEGQFILTLDPTFLSTIPTYRVTLGMGGEDLITLEKSPRIDTSNWLLHQVRVVGPFSIPPAPDLEEEKLINLMEQVFPPESNLDPGAISAQSGKEPLRWLTHTTEGNGFINFKKIFNAEWSVAYALVFVQVPKPMRVMACVGSDDAARLWVNNVIVYTSVKPREARPNQDFCLLPFKQGWNTVLLKVINYQGDWGAYLGISNPGNQLQFAVSLP
ncbi:MAG: metallophosphoesterase [candidate division KSB1 bacterium]|nr:metallophosphoesterase [candidate division KSB1 bacterium]